MKIGGHGFGDHLRLLAPLFGVIAAVWVLRLVMHKAGAPASLVHLVSVSVAGAVSVLIAVLLIHFRRFGSYANVVVAVFLLTCWQELLIVAAIAFAALTGTKNVYIAPQYGGELSHARHIAGHLTFGVGIGTLFGAAMGCLLFWLLRRVVPVAAASKQAS